MVRHKLVNNEIYHVYNRGVEKRKVFLEDADYFRFIHDLFEFNDKGQTSNLGYFLNPHSKRSKSQPIEVGLRYIGKPRKLLVELQVFCLMPNHFHLMLRQKVDGGITEFMRKLGTGYTNYFNKKYERVGPLFQGKYKSVHVMDEIHFIHLPYYIHLNPLGLVAPRWQRGEIENPNRAVKFLENYRWSSYLDYIGKRNFPSVTQRDFLARFFEGPDQYKKDMLNWIKEINLEKIEDLTLE